MLSDWLVERKLLLEVSVEMVRHDLVVASSGNASMRLSGDHKQGVILITPSGKPYRDLTPEDFVAIDLEGDQVEGENVPSSESALHLTLYKARADVDAIIHTHSTFVSVASVAGIEIPPIVDEMVMKIGGSVPVAEYGFPSTEELASRACHAIGDRNAVMLRNHGLVGVGPGPSEALEVCLLAERVAKIFVYASLLGQAKTLPQEIIEIERELFKMQREARSLTNTKINTMKGEKRGNRS